MAALSTALSKQHGLRLLPAIAKLASWRFKQMWRFLLVTWLGMLAMVVLACAPQLFSRVAISAQLHTLAQSDAAQNLLVQVATTSPGEQQVRQIAQQLDHTLRQSRLGPYLQGPPGYIVQTPPLDTLVTGSTKPSALVLDGYDPAQAAQHTALVEGRLPRRASDGSVEIALTQDVARTLGAQVGSLIQGHYPDTPDTQVWQLRVVGIVTPRLAHDPFWPGSAYPFGSQAASSAQGPDASSVLAASGALGSKIAGLHIGSQKSAVRLTWSFPFDITRLDANDMSALSQQASDLQWQLNEALTHVNGVVFALPAGRLFDMLRLYIQQSVVLTIVITFLLLLILAIVLFLVSMLADMLVERQAAVIAMLRSRGATRRHIFGTFVTQGIVLGLAALLAGPFMALLLVRLIAQALLPASGQQALAVITGRPISAALDVRWFATGAVLVALFVMLLAINRASRLDIVTLHREVARTRRPSLWRRLNLDLLLVALILSGYIAYAYFWQTIAATRSFDPVLYNILQGLSFVAPPLLAAALLMLFLRLLPLLLRLANRLAARRRGAPPVLAFAQMERASRPAARVIVLLTLAIAASCFLLTLSATKVQRASDAATFNVGADFSGLLPASDAGKTLDALQARYSRLAGVRSATLGYYSHVNRAAGDIRMLAVDSATYARSALWPQQNAAQALAGLTSQLEALRSRGSARNVVYALVDAALWQQLQLSQGSAFTLPMRDDGSLPIHFIALGEVDYIPGIYDTPVSPDHGIGLLVDYQSYAAVYSKASGTALAPNFILLRTHDDAVSLASVRQALPDLNDRRLQAAANQEDGVHLDIVGVLAIGVGAALILALLGALLSSWLNAASRRAQFVVARALGMAPRQVAAVLLWEQVLVYALSFLLGTGLAALLTTFVAPVVSLLDLAGASALYNPFDVPPVQTILPYQQLLLLLGTLSIICLATLLLMAGIVSRPSPGKALRLNED